VFSPLPGPKGIVIVYPHTSNWDFMIGLLFKFSFGLKVRWMGKDSLFRWPLRRLLLRLGGIPVRRGQRSGFVAAMLGEFAASSTLWLAITPEGTRSRTTHWKSGFYRLATAAELPVGLGYIDYATRTVGIDTYLHLSGDVPADLERIRGFYAGRRGLHPASEGDIQLPP